MCLMVVLAASVRAFVAPVTMRTSISGRQALTGVPQGVHLGDVRGHYAGAEDHPVGLSLLQAAAEQDPQPFRDAPGGLELPVGSSLRNVFSSRVQPLPDNASAPRSSSRRFTTIGR